MSREEHAQQPGIGATLKDARRRLGMDIKEAEERTKIRTRYLRALEAEDWEVLPAPAYVRGFLRSYGQILGLDGAALADRYRRSYEEPAAAAAAPPEPVLRNRGSGSRSPSRSGWIVAIGAAVVVLLAILAVIGLLGDDGSKPNRGKEAMHRSDKGGEKAGGGGGGETERKPIDLKVETLATTQLCLVGGGEPLLDSQVLVAGTTEEFSGEKRYRIDLVGGGTVKVDADGEEKKLEASDDASFEVDEQGIHEIGYAGPSCP